MRIPDEIINTLHELNCEDVAKRFGFEVKKHMTHCFKHEDRVASLGFRHNHWKCFSCDVGGDAISLIRERYSVSFQEACIILCDEYQIQIPESFGHVKKWHNKIETIRQKPLSTTDTAVFDREVAEFIVSNSVLTDSGEEFLFSKRKLDRGIISSLNIHSIDNVNELKAKLLEKFGKERLQKCKMIGSNGTRFAIDCPSLIIPYYDELGQLSSLQTRFLGKDRPLFHVPRFKRICNSPMRLFNLSIMSNISNCQDIFISEGITDCLALLSDGLNAVAIPSATSLPHEDLGKLRRYNIYMVADNDEPGAGAYRKLYLLMLRYGCIVKRICLPDNFKDYSEYYLSKQL